MNESVKQTKNSILPVTGMTCASCAATIEKALKELDEVSSGNVNLASETATVEHNPSKVGMADYHKAVEGAGYGVRSEVSADVLAEPDVEFTKTLKQLHDLEREVGHVRS